VNTPRCLLATALLAMLPATVPALDITWPMTNVVVVDSPHGIPVDAIQSEPAGQPLLLGRPASAGAEKRFRPSLKDEALTFSGPQTSYVAGFWKNFRALTVEVDVTFDSVAKDQTLLRVTGVWEIRLLTGDGPPKLDLIGWRERLKPVAASLEGIKAGKKYVLKARMEADGTMTFESDAAGSATAKLGQPLAKAGTHPELYVGSSNPEKFIRPLQGKISRLRINAEVAP
jgi:hypothetical protein